MLCSAVWPHPAHATPSVPAPCYSLTAAGPRSRRHAGNSQDRTRAICNKPLIDDCAANEPVTLTDNGRLLASAGSPWASGSQGSNKDFNAAASTISVQMLLSPLAAR